jgi:hypothetical protein
MKEKQLKDRTKKDYLLEKDYLCQICQPSSYILIQGNAIGFAPLPLESSTRMGLNDF